MNSSAAIVSDSAALHTLVQAMLQALPDPALLHVLRDPTRGGLASTLNEITRQSQVGMLLREADIPVLPQVAAACELLGLDPLLTAMRAHPLGQGAQRIGTVIEDANGFVQMDTRFGGRRVVDWLSGEQLPRIC